MKLFKPDTGFNRVAVEKDWKSRGFTCDLWTDPPNQVWENYVHEVDELLMLLDGRLELEMQGTKYQLTPHQEILIPAHTPHSVRNKGNTTTHWLYGYKQPH